MVSFICNICRAHNHVENFATEPASCDCGSNVRIRALIHLLSMELFNQTLILADFPKLKAIRGLGMSDKEGYARILAEKFDYTNTQYDREPRMDFTEQHPAQYGTYDFILCADVLEHIAPPVERAIEEASKLLKPHGFLGITIYCNPSDSLREHFPELHEYRVVPLGDTSVLINRRADGALEVRDDVVLHGGTGETLEMREFGATSLKQKLLGSGFRDVHFLTENIPELGILFDQDVSQPLIARKAPFVLEKWAVSQLVDQWLAESQAAADENAKVEDLRGELKTLRETPWWKMNRARQRAGK